MSNEIYTDLEHEHIKQKHQALRMDVIEMLANQYSDDVELGKRVREFINIQQEYNEKHKKSNTTF